MNVKTLSNTQLAADLRLMCDNLVLPPYVDRLMAEAAERIAQQQAAPIQWPKCPGIPDPACDYDAPCGVICNKCGKVHRHHLLGQQAAPSVLEGWKLVPVNGDLRILSVLVLAGMTTEEARDRWSEMLAAAPQPPAQQVALDNSNIPTVDHIADAIKYAGDLLAKYKMNRPE